MSTITLSEASRRIKKLAKNYGSGAVFTPAAIVFAEGARRRVIKGVGPDGTPHPVRSPLTASISGGPRPGRDTGNMVRSVLGFARDGRGGVWMVWGSPLSYALTYEQGATIIPTGRFLTIPMTREAKRFRAREFPRPLHVFPRGARPRSLVEFTRKGAIPVYALVEKVVVPARSFLPPDKRDVSSFWRYLRTVSAETLEGKR